MPVQIIKNPTAAVKAEATVKVSYPTRTGLFAPRVGKVTVKTDAAGKPELNVLCPKEFDEDALWLCYEECVRQAVKNRLGSFVMPLLMPEKRGNCQKAAFNLGASALREALGDREMAVFLLVSEPDVFRLPAELRRSISDYVELHSRFDTETGLVWLDAEDHPCGGDSSFDALDGSLYDAGEAMSEPSPAPPMQQPMPPRPSAPAKLSSQAPKSSLARFLEKTDAGFSETLLKLIDKTGKKDSEIYSRANISRQHFSKIRNNPDYKPTKATALAFAIALELDMEQTRDLIGRAGYTLTRSSRFDLIIMYFIENKNYDLFEINEALFEFDQSLLGA